MSFRAGDSYYYEFTISSVVTGGAVDANTTPVATANHNGTDDPGFALTVALLDTGRYALSGTIPSGYSPGDTINITVAATVDDANNNHITGKALVDSFKIERTAELPSPAPSGYGPGGGSGTTAVTDLTGGTARTTTDSTGIFTVQNSSGAGIMGAVIAAYVTSAYTANPGTAPIITSTTTNVSGGFTLNLPNGANYTLVATYGGDVGSAGSNMGTVTV